MKIKKGLTKSETVVFVILVTLISIVALTDIEEGIKGIGFECYENKFESYCAVYIGK